MSRRFAPDDARRGGLVILGASDDGLARRLAYVGYETVVAEGAETFPQLSAGLDGPVFLLGLPDGATTAWTIAAVSAASIVADARIEAFVDRAPAAPAILHLEPAAHRQLAEAFADVQPELAVHLHPATPDGERLLLLRTLRLFAAAGGRGEV